MGRGRSPRRPLPGRSGHRARRIGQRPLARRRRGLRLRHRLPLLYSLFLARTVFKLDPARQTPAYARNDGLDYVPTNKYVLFGHHFAAIAGAGPLVGPVLAAQMGYLPGTLWILAGVVFAGAVQDFLILFISVRRDGRSLGDMIRTEMGAFAGVVASIGVLAIMVILLAVLALIVVKALANSPWGSFTVFATIPIAILMGLYGRFLRPHRVLEMSLIGFVLLMTSLWLGGVVAADPVWAARFTFSGTTWTFLLIAYGFIASVLPVWVILAPRDYLSTFLKIGTICALAIGILIVMPELRMPALSRFIDGTGPVFAGALFPFLFITIACGSVSGFHALISSGTTPKMMENESQARLIGYGAMLTEKRRRHHGAHCRQHHPARRLFRDECAAGGDRHQRRRRRRENLLLGIQHYP